MCDPTDTYTEVVITYIFISHCISLVKHLFNGHEKYLFTENENQLQFELSRVLLLLLKFLKKNRRGDRLGEPGFSSGEEKWSHVYESHQNHKK